MEQINVRAEMVKNWGIQFMIAMMEAMGVMFLLATISNQMIEQWNKGLSLLLYLLLVVFFLLLLGKREEKK